jgi:hypothetical protein
MISEKKLRFVGSSGSSNTEKIEIKLYQQFQPEAINFYMRSDLSPFILKDLSADYGAVDNTASHPGTYTYILLYLLLSL